MKRQSAKQSLLQILGIFIGGISVLYIYPLDTEMLGFARFIWDTGILFSSVVLLGSDSGLIRFFPRMRLKSGQNFSLPFYSLLLLVGIVFFSIIYMMFGDRILTLLNKNNTEYLVYNNYFFFSIILTSIIMFLNVYCNTLKRIVVPFIASNLIKKITLPLLILASVYGYINTLTFANMLIVTLLLAILLQVVYIYMVTGWRLGKIDWTYIKRNWQPVFNFSFISTFGAIGSNFAFQIDSFMISTLVDYNSNGIYAIAFFIANMVYIPFSALSGIMSPILSENISSKNWPKIDEHYKQGSIIMLTIGIPIFLLGYFCIPDLQNIFPTNKDFQVLGVIVLLIGLTKLFDLATSYNSQILLYSDLYRYNLLLTVLMAIQNIILNYVFIVVFNMGIIGVALASTINLFIFNTAKLVLLYRKYNINPFSQATIFILMLGAFLFGLLWIVPDLSNPYLSVLVKTVFVGIIYTTFVKVFHLSPEVEKYGMELWNKFRIKL
ncbi:lipopolysaccharide biosynthesis protein [Membranihabitans marinus]|uniref:lipopolysaccharide biosynthesis protein n=1 Tax=Membranihabitans marinus TaxID=1227546 RepID=UPI001F4715F5|nr:polysaccharide biosynthesis C-terminal domain-containing protein [Membranihabitans marinus]